MIFLRTKEIGKVYVGHTDQYRKGMFAASLDAVKQNLARYGNLSVRDFRVGFFDQSLILPGRGPLPGVS